MIMRNSGRRRWVVSIFLVKTLKPYIDKHFKKKGSANTVIAGSSMGG
jgi:predicted alpha/beta superfamily hydrolase